MCTFYPGNVVPDHMVHTIPETGAHVLRVKVKGRENVGRTFPFRFERSAQSRHLWWIRKGSARPPVAQKAVVEIVSQVRGDTGIHAGCGVPRHRGACGSRNRIAPSDIDLITSLALLIACFYTSISGVVKAELFPPEVRALGVGLPYAIANALFGGTAEYVALSFKSSGYESVFFYYVAAMAVVALAGSLLMPDTRRHGYLEGDGRV